MAEFVKLPVGVDDFEKIRRDGFYYVDKTGMIRQLLESWGEVNLFTRPRRFGKSLNMSMLKCFFEIGADPSLFEGLYISECTRLCEEYQGRYPVVSISLKGVEGQTYESARIRLTQVVGREAGRFRFLLDSDQLTFEDKQIYRAMIELDHGRYSMEEENLISALQILSELLYKHYGRKTIILIDEYDVPLDKAYQHGYYREMVALIRAMFSEALKTNRSLQFAVLTGCLRVSKESIFTGLNNMKVMAITDARFDEQFGFTDEEVRTLLDAYHLEDHLSQTKEWYDGYHFGAVDVYCPWDVINHVDHLCGQPEAAPQSYWINTSGNELVRRFIDKAGKTTRDEIERLVAGEAIEKPIRLELTYEEIDQSIDNLWSVLFTTGYLTQNGVTDQGTYRLVIPNREVREVYKLQIQEWFQERMLGQTDQLQSFWSALEQGNGLLVEEYLRKVLANSISVFDTRSYRGEKESSYHTLLIGLLAGNSNWLVRSNVEAGDGFADIIIEPEDPDAGIVIELKYTKEMDGLDQACEHAVRQIKEKRYTEYLLRDDRKDILLYGIAFSKKKCRVVVER